MQLIAKLSVTPNHIVQIIDELLPNAQVRISYWGERLVRFNGYEGEIRIADLFTKFLEASVHDTDTEIDITNNQIITTNLTQRIQCYEVWTKLQSLYKTSEQELHKGCFKLLVKLKEIAFSQPSEYDPIAIVTLKTNINWKENLLHFREEYFKALWSDDKPLKKFHLLDANNRPMKWVSTIKDINQYLCPSAKKY